MLGRVASYMVKHGVSYLCCAITQAALCVKIEVSKELVFLFIDLSSFFFNRQQELWKALKCWHEIQ
jgi:hypothetical protein